VARLTSSAAKFARSLGLPLYRLRYTRAARPAGLAVLRIRRRSNQGQIRETVLSLLPVETHHLDQSPGRAADSTFARPEPHGPRQKRRQILHRVQSFVQAVKKTVPLTRTTWSVRQ
jgi:hypothetical protein